MHIPDAGDLINKEVMTCQKQLMDVSNKWCMHIVEFPEFLSKHYQEIVLH